MLWQNLMKLQIPFFGSAVSFWFKKVDHQWSLLFRKWHVSASETKVFSKEIFPNGNCFLSCRVLCRDFHGCRAWATPLKFRKWPTCPRKQPPLMPSIWIHITTSLQFTSFSGIKNCCRLLFGWPYLIEDPARMFRPGHWICFFGLEVSFSF